MTLNKLFASILKLGTMFVLFIILTGQIYSQVIRKNIIDLRTKQKFGTAHAWQFKPGDSVKNANGKFIRASETLTGSDKTGWIKDFPIQLSYTRYRDASGHRPFIDFPKFKEKGVMWVP